MGFLGYVRKCRIFIDKMAFYLIMKHYKVEFSSFRTVGVPFLSVARGGRLSIGECFRINSRPEGNAVAGYAGSVIRVEKDACLTIGKNVGISGSVIVSTLGITIGDNVKIGGGTLIVDSDFHSLVPEERISRDTDMAGARSACVVIRDNVLIGARCIILKGCTIGRNSVVGAGSVVTCDIPDNEIWAGNPAHKIR